jgi:flagellar basal body-associated protein FliL
VTVAIIAVIAVLLVLGVGLLIFRMMKSAQTAVPDAVDPRQTGERVVGVDEHGHQITEAQEPQAPGRDAAGFETLLQDEIRDQGRAAPDED